MLHFGTTILLCSSWCPCIELSGQLLEAYICDGQIVGVAEIHKPIYCLFLTPRPNFPWCLILLYFLLIISLTYNCQHVLFCWMISFFLDPWIVTISTLNSANFQPQDHLNVGLHCFPENKLHFLVFHMLRNLGFYPGRCKCHVVGSSSFIIILWSVVFVLSINLIEFKLQTLLDTSSNFRVFFLGWFVCYFPYPGASSLGLKTEHMCCWVFLITSTFLQILPFKIS